MRACLYVHVVERRREAHSVGLTREDQSRHDASMQTSVCPHESARESKMGNSKCVCMAICLYGRLREVAHVLRVVVVLQILLYERL